MSTCVQHFHTCIMCSRNSLPVRSTWSSEDQFGQAAGAASSVGVQQVQVRSSCATSFQKASNNLEAVTCRI